MLKRTRPVQDGMQDITRFVDCGPRIGWSSPQRSEKRRPRVHVCCKCHRGVRIGKASLVALHGISLIRLMGPFPNTYLHRVDIHLI
jgi:hypothetical protein